MRPELLFASIRALILGTYSISFKIRLIFSTVAFETRPVFPCITFETVVGLTPARSAISLILIIGSPPFLFLHNFLNSVMFILPRRQNVYNYFASANTTKLLHFLKRYVRKSPSLLHLLSAGSVVR